MSAVREFIQTRENVTSTLNKLCLSLCVLGNTLCNYTTLLYNYCRLRFYEYLDVVGFREYNGVYCLYYYYNDQQYLIPVPRTRGPTVENTILNTYFSTNRDLMHMFMGPRGDWHGREDYLIQNLNI